MYCLLDVLCARGTRPKFYLLYHTYMYCTFSTQFTSVQHPPRVDPRSGAMCTLYVQYIVHLCTALTSVVAVDLVFVEMLSSGTFSFSLSPKCRLEYTQGNIPQKYTCFCGKTVCLATMCLIIDELVTIMWPACDLCTSDVHLSWIVRVESLESLEVCVLYRMMRLKYLYLNTCTSVILCKG